MTVVLRKLCAELVGKNHVRVWIDHQDGTELRQLLERNLDTAEQEFIRTYGLTPSEAAIFRARIERDGSACVPTAL